MFNFFLQKEEEALIETFDDDKDPFDTSAFEHLTKEVEEDQLFDNLANRDPHETVSAPVVDSEPGNLNILSTS